MNKQTSAMASLQSSLTSNNSKSPRNRDSRYNRGKTQGGTTTPNNKVGFDLGVKEILDVIPDQPVAPKTKEVDRAKEMNQQQEVIEKHFSFFQIENKLRELSKDANAALRSKMTKESELVRKMQGQIDVLKNDSREHSKQIERALSSQKNFDKVFKLIEVNRQTAESEIEKLKGSDDTMEILMERTNTKFAELQKQHSTEMALVDRATERISNSIEMMEKHKQKMREYIDTEIARYVNEVEDFKRPYESIRNEFENLSQKVDSLMVECDERKVETDVADQRIALLTKRITELEKNKQERAEFIPWQKRMDSEFDGLSTRLLADEKCTAKAIDYFLRFQWQETRNAINDAILKVTRPLQLKELFIENVGADHLIFKDPFAPKISPLEEYNAQAAVGDSLQSGPLGQPLSQGTGNTVNMGSVQAVQLPDVVVKDFVFASDESVVEPKIDQAIQHATQITNLETVDWDFLQAKCKENWARIRQEQYKLVSKLSLNAGASQGSKPPSRSATNKKDKKKGGRGERGGNSRLKKERGADRDTKARGGGLVKRGGRKESQKKQRREGRHRGIGAGRRTLPKEYEQELQNQLATQSISRGAAQISVQDESLLVEEENSPQPRNAQKRGDHRSKRRDRTRRNENQVIIEQNYEQVGGINEKGNGNGYNGVGGSNPMGTGLKTTSEGDANFVQERSQLTTGNGETAAIIQPGTHSLFEQTPNMGAEEDDHDDPLYVASAQQTPDEKRSENNYDDNELGGGDGGQASGQNLHQTGNSDKNQPAQTSSPPTRQKQNTAHEEFDSIRSQPNLDQSPQNAQQVLAQNVQKAAQPPKQAIVKVVMNNSKNNASVVAQQATPPEIFSESQSESDETTNSYSSEFEEDELTLEEETADGERLGIDLTKYMKREEWEFNKDKLQQRFEDLEDFIEEQKERVDQEIRAKGYEFAKGVDVIDKKLIEHMKPIHEDMHILMKSRNRQKNDDLIKQQAIVERFDKIHSAFQEIQKTVEKTLCPIVVCLFENQIIQMRVEEQDELDKYKTALFGHQENLMTVEGDLAKAKRDANFDLTTQTGSIKKGIAIAKQPHAERSRSPQKSPIPKLDLNRTAQTQEKSVEKSPEKSKEDRMSPKNSLNLGTQTPNQTELANAVIESNLGETGQRLSLLNSFMQKDPFARQQNWLRGVDPSTQIIQFDQKCLSCTPDQNQIAKLFKLACLAYKPSQVQHRDLSFKREQLMSIRRFLVGQMAQLVLNSQTMNQMNLSPKRIFDDIYLHITSQVRNKQNVGIEAEAQFSLIEKDQETGLKIPVARSRQPIFSKTTEAATQESTQNPFNFGLISQSNNNNPNSDESTTRQGTAYQTRNLTTSINQEQGSDFGIIPNTANAPERGFFNAKKLSVDYAGKAHQQRLLSHLNNSASKYGYGADLSQRGEEHQTSVLKDFEESLMSQTNGLGGQGGQYRQNILRPNMLNLNLDVPISTTTTDRTTTFADKRRTISLTSRENLASTTDFGGNVQMRHTAVGFSKKNFGQASSRNNYEDHHLMTTLPPHQQQRIQHIAAQNVSSIRRKNNGLRKQGGAAGGSVDFGDIRGVQNQTAHHQTQFASRDYHQGMGMGMGTQATMESSVGVISTAQKSSEMSGSRQNLSRRKFDISNSKVTDQGFPSLQTNSNQQQHTSVYQHNGGGSMKVKKQGAIQLQQQSNYV